ncbi:MAG: PadR family transcriptional regulator [Candidatus Micrarchaeota archaeon]|nr:PadR family transcriptional regulator [Candidatus Micrarchaeota archaeon]
MSAQRECGCDMRGFLSFQILWLLSKRSMHGEAIAQEIAKRRGEKPKAGTLYPALKDLSDKGLINGDKAGKTVTYSLTADGRLAVKQARAYFVRCFGEIMSGRN